MNTIQKHFFLLCMIAVVTLTIAGRIWIASQKPLLEHDEAITLLAATGHQGELAQVMSQQAPPFNMVVEGREWRRFLLPEDYFVFRRIASDLSKFDIHPPLYFWLLHLWVLVLGASAFSGALLNIVLSAIIAIVLFHIARKNFSWPLAYLVVILWLLSPISIRSMTFIRHYHLFALLSLLYAYTTFRVFFVSERYQFNVKSSLTWMVMAVLVMLTHSLAIFTVVASVISVLLKAALQDRKRIFALGVHLLLAVGIVLLIHPDYIGQFGKGRGVSETNLEVIMQRSDTSIALLLSFIVDIPYQTGIYSWVRPAMILGLLLGTILPLITSWRLLRPPRLQQIYENVQMQAATYWCIFFVIVGGSTTALYMAGMSPLDYRYYTQALVFVVFLPAYFLSLPILNGIRSKLIFLVIALMMLSGGLTAKQVSESYKGLGDPARYPNSSEFILVNISRSGRGHLMQMAYNLPDDALVYVDMTEGLLNNPAVWLEQMAVSDTTLLLGFPNAELFQKIQDAGYVVEPYASYLYYTTTKRVHHR